ncbi:MAG: DUF4097 family beta strand repeat protein [Thermoplasmata archaeon]|nr:MAG: DUF4097 family beta strand repeat protein [Thermoplasmata archaeon]
MRRAKIAGLAIVVILSTAIVAGCIGTDLVTDDFDGLYGVNEDSVLRVTNRNGDVEITRTNGDQVELHVDISSTHGQESIDDLDIVVDETGGNVAISTEYSTQQNQATANMKIKVPWYVHISQVTTSNGDVDVRIDMSEGDAEVSSSNGDVKVSVREGFTHNLTATSSNGNVEVIIDPDEDLMITASTSNGRVTFSGLDVTFTVDQPKSKIGTMGAGGTMLTATTSNGDVDVRSS